MQDARNATCQIISNAIFSSTFFNYFFFLLQPLYLEFSFAFSKSRWFNFILNNYLHHAFDSTFAQRRCKRKMAFITISDASFFQCLNIQMSMSTLTGMKFRQLCWHTVMVFVSPLNYIRGSIQFNYITVVHSAICCKKKTHQSWKRLCG